ncbi:MAG: hypothetical protein QM535_02685 [Limnohabitans sp.]|nr:hypothetical protein [Limnohabitans sp.]
MKRVLILSFFFLSFIGLSQTINDYNKAIVPAKFAFQKEPNQYRVNLMVKTFLKQKGFEVYLDNEAPEGFNDYNCNKIFVNAVTDNTVFSTRIKFEFKDCKNNVLFVTDFGESREKDLPTAYNAATLYALKSFDAKAFYKFSGKDYDDEEVEARLNANDKVDVAVKPTTVVKNESFIKVIDKVSGTELMLFKTSKSDLFLANYKGANGVVLSKNGVWFFEYVQGGKVESKKLDIKL